MCVQRYKNPVKPQKKKEANKCIKGKILKTRKKRTALNSSLLCGR